MLIINNLLLLMTNGFFFASQEIIKKRRGKKGKFYTIERCVVTISLLASFSISKKEKTTKAQAIYYCFFFVSLLL